MQIQTSNDATGERRHDIDWLRIIAVFLPIPFHTARIFDLWETNYVKNGQTSDALSYLIAVIAPWHMPLLFALAGAASWFALGRRALNLIGDTGSGDVSMSGWNGSSVRMEASGSGSMKKTASTRIASTFQSPDQVA